MNIPITKYLRAEKKGKSVKLVNKTLLTRTAMLYQNWFTETKAGDLYVHEILLHSYIFFQKTRKQNNNKSSGGIGVFIKEELLPSVSVKDWLYFSKYV